YGLSEKSITSPSHVSQQFSHIRSSPSSRHGNNSSSHIDISGLVHFQQKHCVPKESRSVQTDLLGKTIDQLIQVNSGQASEKNKKHDELARLNNDLEYRLKETNTLALQYKDKLTRCLQVSQELLI
uniref:Uncharacterized protein n=1 Tax=Ciona savignyi TaxID=51511 RepID=H2YPS9_CIOSA